MEREVIYRAGEPNRGAMLGVEHDAKVRFKAEEVFMGAADVSDTGEGRGFATTAVEAKEDAGSMWGGDYKYDGGTHRGGRAGRVWVVLEEEGMVRARVRVWGEKEG